MKFGNFQEIIDLLRGKKKSIANIRKNNHIEISKINQKHIKLNIIGLNNTVIIKGNLPIHGKITIDIFGSNNTIIIEQGFALSLSGKMHILIGQNHPNFGEVNNSTFTIGENTSVESMQYVTFNNNSYCNIGKNCMLAFDITLFNTDAHPIMDINSNEIINKVKGISIGNHCWIGNKVTILKNTVIPDNCIVGYGSVITGTKEASNAIYAGNPAKLVKQNINWNSNGNKYGYIKNE